MLKKLTPVTLVLLLLAIPVQGWNNKGHMVVAYIAYMELDDDVKLKVDALLQRHPDFHHKLTAFAGPPNGANYRLIIFMNAATWPDSIREDPRFYDETDPDSIPTPKLPGFPTMKKMKPWHYIDFPFSPDNSPLAGPASINALKLMRASRHALNNQQVPLNNQAYLLAWLLHVAGDVHQPLHCTSRFTAAISPPDYPEGDRGGNEFVIKPFPVPEANYRAENLHSFWDGVLGVKRELSSVRTLATSIMNQHPKPTTINTNEQAWIDESFRLARSDVYTIDPDTSIKPAYFSNAQRLARERIAIAGYRIAEVLNERF